MEVLPIKETCGSYLYEPKQNLLMTIDLATVKVDVLSFLSYPLFHLCNCSYTRP